jgi:hypothetical protein
MRTSGNAISREVRAPTVFGLAEGEAVEAAAEKRERRRERRSDGATTTAAIRYASGTSATTARGGAMSAMPRAPSAEALATGSDGAEAVAASTSAALRGFPLALFRTSTACAAPAIGFPMLTGGVAGAAQARMRARVNAFLTALGANV